MEGSIETLGTVLTLCPKCMRELVGEYVRYGNRVELERECPECGMTTTVVWNDREDLSKWYPDLAEADCSVSLDSCCAQQTSLALLEITSRCNANCQICFAKSGEGTGADPTFEEMAERIDSVAKTCSANGFLPILQLSGGEPTVRDDLADIIAYVRSAGFDTVQLNTNGMKIAEDLDYLKSLADAGLSYVFMGFDSVDDDVYEALRSNSLCATKVAAIENCKKAEVGVVLVPTIVRGQNEDQIGKLIEFALRNAPIVRGIHFQPAASMGRVYGDPIDHFTLDELTSAIYEQAPDIVEAGALSPSRCDHPMCGFHATFIQAEDGRLIGPIKAEGDSGVMSAKANRDFIARRWTYFKDDGLASAEEGSMEYVAQRSKTHSFTISAMAFLDATTMDSNRLRRCSLHVYEPGKGLIPFCLKYVTPIF